jgi:hypothetical protein
MTSGTTGFEWKPIGDGSNLRISHELREGAIRPGPQRLWDQFDFAVGSLGHALAHGPLGSVVRAYRQRHVPDRKRTSRLFVAADYPPSTWSFG